MVASLKEATKRLHDNHQKHVFVVDDEDYLQDKAESSNYVEKHRNDEKWGRERRKEKKLLH